MRKFFVILLIISALPIYAREGEKGSGRLFTWGVEWGGGSEVRRADSFQFRSPEGFAVDGRRSQIRLHAQGFAAAFAGINVNRRLSVAAFGGYEGLSEGIRVWPVGLRAGYSLGRSVGWGIFADAGAGLPASGLKKAALILAAGCNRDIDIGYGAKIRFSVAGRLAYAHPQLVNHYTGEYVPPENVWKSDSIYLGAKVSMAVVF